MKNNEVYYSTLKHEHFPIHLLNFILAVDSHPYIKSALVLRNQFSLSEIDQIVIGVNETADMLCQPLEDRCHPKTLQDAKFSIPFMVAFTFVHGSVHLNNLTAKALMNLVVLDLTKRIIIEQTQDNTPGIPLGDIKPIVTSGTKRNMNRIKSETAVNGVKQKFIECVQFGNAGVPERLWELLSVDLDFDMLKKLPLLDSRG